MENTDSPQLINQLLNEADAALVARRWSLARARASAVLSLDSNNGEAQSIVESAESAINAVAKEGRIAKGKRRPPAG